MNSEHLPFMSFHTGNVGKKRKLKPALCTLPAFLMASNGSFAQEVQNRAGNYISIYSTVLRLETIETGQKK